MIDNDSSFIAKEACPECGSRDNLARYSDGHGFCFGCSHYEPANGEAIPRERKLMSPDLIPAGEIKALTKRGISRETCEKFGYSVGRMADTPVQIAAYRDAKGNVVAQKIRWPDKEFRFLGDTKEALLFGQHLCRDGGKRLVITEGEIDALSVSQVFGNRWPVVSIQGGAQGAKKAIQKAYEFVSAYEEVVIMFDMDEPGMKAALEVAALLPPGKAKIASLPLKDANEMLMAGREKEVATAVFEAKLYRPDGVVSIGDIKDKALMPVSWGLPWWIPELTKATYGRRYGEIYTFGAGTGVGKTDWFTQQIAYDVTTLGLKVGVVYLEQPVAETAKRLAGKIAGRRFHVPDAGWTVQELSDTIDILDGKVHLYDHFGETDWAIVESKVRYMVVSLGIKLIYIDHLTALADPSNERESLEKIMEEMASLAQELGVIIHLISHLATPEGKPHEEGGRVMIRHFKGSRSIGFWSHFMFGLERSQHETKENIKGVTTFRVLKDRYTGQSTGLTIFMGYDPERGMLNVLDHNPFEETSPFVGSTDSF
jgi:twinkle protein